MPRVHHVEHAAKDHPDIGVKKGEPYYWWKFKNRVGNGTVVKSKTPPKASQLTRSEFASTWRSIEEQIEALPLDESLHEALQGIAGDLHALADEQDEKFNNMPEGLQQGSTGELLEQRRDAANEWADAIEALDEPSREEADPEPLEREEGESDEDFQARVEQEQQDAEERADEAYDEALSGLKQEALDANPGEP